MPRAGTQEMGWATFMEPCCVSWLAADHGWQPRYVPDLKETHLPLNNACDGDMGFRSWKVYGQKWKRAQGMWCPAGQVRGHVMGCQEGLNGVTFKLRTEGGEGKSCGDFWGDSSPDRGHGKCKGPGAELCLGCWRNSEACVAGAE